MRHCCDAGIWKLYPLCGGAYKKMRANERNDRDSMLEVEGRHKIAIRVVLLVAGEL